MKNDLSFLDIAVTGSQKIGHFPYDERVIEKVAVKFILFFFRQRLTKLLKAVVV